MTLSEYKYNDIIHRCFRCGYCKFPTDWDDVTNCPSYARYRMESFSSGGRLWLIRAWVNGDIQWSEHLTKIIYSCTSCKNCVEKCPHTFSDDLVNMVVAAKTELIKIGKIPKPVKDFLENTQLYGNPYGISAKKRADWMEDLDIPAYNGHDYLYYVGCDGSFDPRAQKAARATARLLMSAGVSFGILGTDEISDGNEVDMLGEDGLLEYLAQKNIQKFSKLGVKNIITLSPHSYNVFKNKYPDFGGQYQVYHYTQILAGLIKNGKLKVPDTSGISITFHDPCFLGRWNKEYDAPRKIIQSFKGMTFNEMARNRKGALCCGGGAGNFYTDFLGGSDESPARIRIREAVDTRADVLAVACPNCLMMLEDAAASEGSEIIVKDISEIFFPE
ncbi:MAG: (Fe-S)-binding protein [Proteobacteria bacterium]|nr:(Fe-S)-binding protein [Pseudomonadota bacterium]MBU1387450.1 (Fe-S)-binding protein [Pseudomonadota bacterium]MBU1541963.1 (Fe-S)-binding protein [Pseudomonadota bacterium]MBU2431258.1 (Fe-S)-binding protein [Pseudomonadota bacterium]MBU2479568.1 (Fe-S)-binding protein [Pseudomonadota bacterium]